MTLETICSYLDDEGFGYAASSSGGAVQTGFRGKHGLYSVLMTLTGDPLCFVVHVRLPLVVPDDRRADVCETVVRANHGLLIGGFDFHISEGLLLYRAAAPVADADLTREQFRQFLFACLILADRYARAFQRLLFADDLSPAEVIAEVEMD